MVRCKLNLNSSLTDSVRDEFQVQFGSNHFHGAAHIVPFSAAGISLGCLNVGAAASAHWALPAMMYVGRAGVLAHHSKCDPRAIRQQSLCENLCDPCAIHVRSASDPCAIRMLFARSW